MQILCLWTRQTGRKVNKNAVQFYGISIHLYSLSGGHLSDCESFGKTVYPVTGKSVLLCLG